MVVRHAIDFPGSGGMRKEHSMTDQHSLQGRRASRRTILKSVAAAILLPGAIAHAQEQSAAAGQSCEGKRVLVLGAGLAGLTAA
jgi:threonine dehydrogenase-like Zn-dependent dehydrogenase